EELSPDTATVVVTGLDDPAVAELARGRAHGRGALRRPGDAERAGAQRAALPRRRLPQRRDRPLARHRGRHGARAHPQRHAQARRGDADAGDRDRDAPPPDRVGRDPSRPPWRSARAGAASGRYPYGVCRAGSTSRKRLPCPTSESSSTRPPSARASSRAIGSPSPVPLLSPETKGRKIRSCCSGGMPGPLSEISTSTLPFATPTPSATRPPSGVQRSALESRLVMICSTRSPSVMITGGRPLVTSS